MLHLELVRNARKRVWGNLAGADLDGGDGRLGTVQAQIEKWIGRMSRNAKKREAGLAAEPPEEGSFIHTHDDVRDAPLVRLS